MSVLAQSADIQKVNGHIEKDREQTVHVPGIHPGRGSKDVTEEGMDTILQMLCHIAAHHTVCGLSPGNVRCKSKTERIDAEYGTVMQGKVELRRTLVERECGIQKGSPFDQSGKQSEGDKGIGKPETLFFQGKKEGDECPEHLLGKSTEIFQE